MVRGRSIARDGVQARVGVAVRVREQDSHGAPALEPVGQRHQRIAGRGSVDVEAVGSGDAARGRFAIDHDGSGLAQRLGLALREHPRVPGEGEVHRTVH